MGRKIYTDEQLDYVKRQYNLLSPREIGHELNLSEEQVRYIIKEKLGISLRKIGNRSRTWTSKEIEILSNSNLTDYEKVKLLPNRTDAAVRKQRRRMGLDSRAVVFNRQFENNGYVHVRRDGGYKRRNREVAEQKIGRKLRDDEIVHHINGVKTDDRPENLHVCTRAEHTAIHYQTMDVIKELLEKGYVKFDFEKGEYVLCRNL